MTSTVQKQTFSRPVCWISTIKRIEIQRKKASSLINGNLYHYAGNNPVRYIDPNGREDFFSNWLLDWFSHNTLPPTQQDVVNASMQHAEQQFNDCMQNVQYKLSSNMEKVMNVAGDAIIAGAEFMSDYGSVIAVACYASGNVGIGMVIDGIAVACDITLCTIEYQNSNKTVADADKLKASIIGSIVTTGIGLYTGSSIQKNLAKKLVEEKLALQIANSAGDLVSSLISTGVEVYNESTE